MSSPAPDEVGRSDRLANLLRWAALTGLAAWSAAPLVYLLLRAMSHDESLSGGDSLFAADQLQYLAWIRSSGEHILATNGFDLRDGGHTYLQPMFLLSGLVWRAGLGIVISFLLWLPVAVAVLYLGFARYTCRMLQSSRARAATLLLALFFVTPADPLVGWTVGSNGLGTLAGELAPAVSLYGYFPIAITTGLMPLFMLGLEQIVAPERRRRGRSASRYIASTAAIGLTIAWLHPWQGVTLLLVVAGLLIRGRFSRSDRILLIPALVTAVPLLYYFALSKLDLAWKIGQSQSAPSRPNVLLLALALAPLLVFAAAAARDRGHSIQDLVLVLWPLSALIVYFVSPGYATHALEALSLPLGLLAARGWQRLGLPAWLAACAIVIATVPGLIFNVQRFHEAAVADQQGLLLDRDETRALAYVEHAHNPGGVLPSLRISAAVPAYTGRRTWIGHAEWTPNYSVRAREVSQLFAGQLSAAAGQRFLRNVGARYILADCEPNFAPSWLAALTTAEHRFGCVTVYTLSGRAPRASL